MAISYLNGQVASASGQGPSSKKRSELKEAIKDFLAEAASTPLHGEVCPRCGRKPECIETIFWLYDDEDAFGIRLPVCSCAAKTSEG